jgi:nicotinate-nucleotide adenylyltransferase
MKNVGLYFGTFNPVHVGHLIIANHMAYNAALDEVWLVVSPQNPLKQKAGLLADYHRLALVRIAIEDNIKLRASEVEFNLPKPSYTVDTLVYLREAHPNVSFSLIMGEDNLRTLHKWKNFEVILEHHQIYVYPRVLTEQERTDLKGHRTPASTANHPHIIKVDAPVMRVSASFVRRTIQEGKSVRYLLTEKVRAYLEEMHFYE